MAACCRVAAAFAERDFLFLVPMEPEESLLGLIRHYETGGSATKCGPAWY
jgi:hypothetical protein